MCAGAIGVLSVLECGVMILSVDKRGGTVFITWWEHHTGSPSYYTGYWDSVEDGADAGVIEKMANTHDLDVALEWARARANRVYVRPKWNRSQPYWGGDYTDDRYPPLPRP